MIIGFYDTPEDTYLKKPGYPGRLEQTVFIVLASVAGLAFILIISLLLCKFQWQVDIISAFVESFYHR